LRQVLAAQAGEREPFRLRPASFNGLGLRRELQEASWDRLRELAYEGHGT
jgi:hypothetical protein